MGYFHPRTTEERMHLAELQRGAVMNRGYPPAGGRRLGHKNMVCHIVRFAERSKCHESLFFFLEC